MALTGVRCLSVGRALARTECGLAFAAQAILKGRVEDFATGLGTVQGSVSQVHGMMPSGDPAARKIMTKVSALQKELSKDRKISKEKARGMLRTVQDLKVEVDRLFATGARECPGAKRKRG